MTFKVLSAVHFGNWSKISPVLVLLLGLCLTACGQNPATSTPGLTAAPSLSANPSLVALNSAAPGLKATTVPGLPPTSPSTGSIPVTAKITSQSAATSTPRPNSNGSFNPVISFSAANFKGGDTLTVSGTGFPANTKLQVLLGSEGAKGSSYAAPVTNPVGKFSAQIKLDVPQSGGPLPDSKIIITVITEDGSVSASAPLALATNPTRPAYKPALTLSKQSVPFGEGVTLSGSGYPPEALLKLLGGVQNPGTSFTQFYSDNQGNFNFTLNLILLPDGAFFQTGPYTFAVTSQDGQVKASATLQITKSPYNPILKVSGDTAPIGSDLTLTGSGFPPGSRLRLAGGTEKPYQTFTTLVSDAGGNLTFKLNLSKMPDGTAYKPGQFHFEISTLDTGIGNEVTVKIVDKSAG